jgi:hypothetical protein
METSGAASTPQGLLAALHDGGAELVSPPVRDLRLGSISVHVRR